MTRGSRHSLVLLLAALAWGLLPVGCGGGPEPRDRGPAADPAGGERDRGGGPTGETGPGEEDDEEAQDPEEVELQGTYTGADAKCVLGVQKYEEGEYEEAIRFFLEALSIESNHADSLVGLGVVHYAQGNESEAIPVLQRAIRVSREQGKERLQAMAWWHLALSYGQQDRWREALRAVERCLGLAPDFEQAQHWLPEFRRRAEGRPPGSSGTEDGGPDADDELPRPD